MPENNLTLLIDSLTAPGLHDPDAPKVVFPSSLELTLDQEKRMVRHAEKWFHDLKRDLGRDEAVSTNFATGEINGAGEYRRAARSFMGKRRLYEMRSQNETDYRSHLYGGVFAETDVSLPMDTRIVRQQVARAVDYFFGTDPWISASPVGPEDTEKAKRVQSFIRHKTDKSGCKDKLIDAIEKAFVINEAVVKTTYRRDFSYHRTTRPVLIDPATNEPFVALDGDYVFENDAREVQSPDGAMVLKRDGQTVLPRPHRFEARQVRRGVKTFDGIDLNLVHFLDFLAPLDARTLDEAMCICHIYDIPAAQLIERYLKLHHGLQSDDDLRRLQPLLTKIGSAERSGDRLTGDERDGELHSSTNHDVNPMAPLAEFHMWYDADGDGVMEDICLIVNRENWTPLFYETVPNTTPDGKRPYAVVRSRGITNRWYGEGTYEAFEPIQRGIDLKYARMEFANSRAGRVDFFDHTAVLEGDANPHLEINGGRTYHLKPNKDVSKVLQSVYLTDSKLSDGMQMLELLIQFANNISGVASVNDNKMAGLNTSDLATGINAMERSGQELFGFNLKHLNPGIQAVMSRGCTLALANLDQRETFKLTEGNNELLMEITPEDVVGLDLDVKIVMTRYKNEQLVAQMTKAREVFNAFYALPPQLQKVGLPLFVNELSVYEVPNPEGLLVPGLMEPPQVQEEQEEAPLAPGGGGGNGMEEAMAGMMPNAGAPMAV